MADQAGREAKAHLLNEPDDVALPALARQLQSLAITRAISVATAESCTGGLVGHAITSHAGASAFYLGGVVSYADRVKVEALGVTPEALEHHGAVSAQVAVAMAEGVRTRFGSDFAVAVTGVAGPDGGSDTKPVGLTYVAVAGPTGHDVRRFHWSGDRGTNKDLSAAAALTVLIEVVAASPVTPADAPA